MAQAQVKQFPGFGVVYPDGISGIKVIRTYTQGPSKVVNPDGSVGYITPPPTILELFGGGFAYADGSPVIDRAHLEKVSDLKMREKALKWFDESRELSEVSRENIPPLNLDEKVRPEPVYVLSSELPRAEDEVTKELDKAVTGNAEVQGTLASIAEAISSLATIVKEQGKQIEALQNQPGQVKRRSPSDKRSELMKAKWADPAWRARRESKKHGKDVTQAS